MEQPRAYCTYFDIGYLSRGLALIESLRAHGDNAPVWVLTLDDATKAFLDSAKIPGVFTLTIADVEAAEPQLPALKTSRSRMEYYFTSTPLLVRWVMNKQTDQATVVIYLDSDLYFFDDPSLVLEELGDASVGIIEHRYPHRLEERLAKYGRFNVGWVGFRGDQNGRACLDWWAASTLEWCSDIPDHGRYADQGYLDSFPERFGDVAILQPGGLNLAPWNTGRHKLTKDPKGKVLVDSTAPLVFFHFHGLRRVGSWYVSSQLIYGSRLGRVLRNQVYVPYIRRLEAANRRVAESLGEHPATNKKRGTGWYGAISRLRKSAIDRLTILSGNAISVNRLNLD